MKNHHWNYFSRTCNFKYSHSLYVKWNQKNIEKITWIIHIIMFLTSDSHPTLCVWAVPMTIENLVNTSQISIPKNHSLLSARKFTASQILRTVNQNARNVIIFQISPTILRNRMSNLAFDCTTTPIKPEAQQRRRYIRTIRLSRSSTLHHTHTHSGMQTWDTRPSRACGYRIAYARQVCVLFLLAKRFITRSFISHTFLRDRAEAQHLCQTVRHGGSFGGG